MRVTTLLAAAIGAFVGAVIWAVIAATTGYEVGWVAWGIGALVGFGAKIAGGGGKPVAVACAGLALLGIFGGKMMAVRYAFAKFSEKAQAELTSRERYNEEVKDASDIAAVMSESEYPAFMIAHNYVGASDVPGVISAEDLKDFKEETVPHLRKLHSEKPTYETWLETRENEIAEEFRGGPQMTDLARIVVTDLAAMDFVFAFLGVATAYRVALSAEQKSA